MGETIKLSDEEWEQLQPLIDKASAYRLAVREAQEEFYAAIKKLFKKINEIYPELGIYTFKYNPDDNSIKILEKK